MGEDEDRARIVLESHGRRAGRLLRAQAEGHAAGIDHAIKRLREMAADSDATAEKRITLSLAADDMEAEAKEG